MGEKTKKKNKGLRGFKVLSVSLSADNVDDKNETRSIYYKKHNAKKKYTDDSDEEEDTSDRTLFAVNIPINYEYTDVMTLFSCFGAVSSVVFQGDAKKIDRAVSALVIFEDASSLKTALESDMRDTVQPYQAGSKATGVKKWVEQYHKHRPASEGLQLQVDRFMEMFETREQKEKEAMKDGPVVDDEGFTLVQYKKKSTKRNLGNVGGDESVTENKKKKRKTETEDFYKFQARKAKEDKLDELRRKFEEDKARIAKMKADRKFRPF